MIINEILIVHMHNQGQDLWLYLLIKEQTAVTKRSKQLEDNQRRLDVTQ